MEILALERIDALDVGQARPRQLPHCRDHDIRHQRLFLAAGYLLTAVQPFDLFPQTRHLECVITLGKPA